MTCARPCFLLQLLFMPACPVCVTSYFSAISFVVCNNLRDLENACFSVYMDYESFAKSKLPHVFAYFAFHWFQFC